VLGELDRSAPLRVEVKWRDDRGAVRQRILSLTPGNHRVLLTGKAV
jgi:hypothetical protein